MVTTFTNKLSELLADAQAKLRTGFSWDTLSEAFLTFIHGAMLAAKDELKNDGPEKKKAVLDWVGSLFDWIVTAAPLPTWLYWVKIPLVKQGVRSIVMAIAGGLIEGLYSQFVEQYRVA